jgi:hypothetical protein
MAAVQFFMRTSLAGLAWGWQVEHNRTVFWTTLHYSLLLMVMSLFGL